MGLRYPPGATQPEAGDPTAGNPSLLLRLPDVHYHVRYHLHLLHCYYLPHFDLPYFH